MIRRLLLAYLAGVASVIGVAFHAGPEAVVVAGLKFAAASSDYDWTAVPKEAEPVAYDTRSLVLDNHPIAGPANRNVGKGKRR